MYLNTYKSSAIFCKYTVEMGEQEYTKRRRDQLEDK